jgi:hypothetical protein
MAAKCLAASSRAVDRDGFVPVRNLLEYFQASIELRPLLVEAMLCEKLGETPASPKTQWHLLIDCEQHPIALNDVSKESNVEPLSDRLRNTIAHELAHTLAFRTTDSGRELILSSKRKPVSLVDDVAEIERCTEELSPLLLVADSSIAQAFRPDVDRLRVDDLTRARAAFGVSRYILVSRLDLLTQFGDPRIALRPSLSNVGIGVGKWGADGIPCLLGTPMYLNFDRAIAPKFFHWARKEKQLDFYSITSDPNFILNGGKSNVTELTTKAGTPKNPEIAKMKVELAVEQRVRKAGETFLVLVSANH